MRTTMASNFLLFEVSHFPLSLGDDSPFLKTLIRMFGLKENTIANKGRLVIVCVGLMLQHRTSMHHANLQTINSVHRS